MKSKSVALIRFDWAADPEDLVQDAFANLLTRAPRYDPNRAPFLRWVYYRTIRYFQSSFRKAANRHRCMEELATKRPGRKGAVRADGQICDNYGSTPEEEWCDDYRSINSLSTENAVYEYDREQHDPRPYNEQMIDLHDQITELPVKQRQVIQLMLGDSAHDPMTDDQIAWQMGIHPTTVSALRKQAMVQLGAVLS